jgi:hypothetical protein
MYGPIQNLCASIFSMKGDVPLTYGEVCPLNVKVLPTGFNKYKFKTVYKVTRPVL